MLPLCKNLLYEKDNFNSYDIVRFDSHNKRTNLYFEE